MIKEWYLFNFSIQSYDRSMGTGVKTLQINAYYDTYKLIVQQENAVIKVKLV